MARLRLLDSNSEPIEVDQDETARCTITLKDYDNAVLNEAAILSLQITLTDVSGTVINSREDEDVMDAGIGVVATDGTLTLRLATADNAIIDTTLAYGQTELHVLLVQWTWNDGVGVQTGRQEYEYPVRKVALT